MSKEGNNSKELFDAFSLVPLSFRISSDISQKLSKYEKSASATEADSLDDPYGIRTRVTAVKGRCLNRLTNGPDIYGSGGGIEPPTSRV